MPDHPKSAAASIYPHLKSGTPDIVQQREQPTLAQALYPPPKSAPPNRYRQSADVSLAQRCAENPQLEWLLGMCGIRRR